MTAMSCVMRVLRWRGAATARRSRFVDDVGDGAVDALSSFFVPFSLLVLVLYDFGPAGNLLFGGGALGGGARLGVGRKRFGKNRADLVSPAAVMFDDGVSDFSHGFLACGWGADGARWNCKAA